MKSKDSKKIILLMLFSVLILAFATLALTGLKENQREEAALTEAMEKAEETDPDSSGGADNNAAGAGAGSGGQTAAPGGGTDGSNGNGASSLPSADPGVNTGTEPSAVSSGGTAADQSAGTAIPGEPILPDSQRIVVGNRGSSTGTGGQVTEIRLTGTTTYMLQAETLQLVPTILPESAAGTPLTWRSSDEYVARVTQTGLVTSLRGGNVVISASSPNGVTVEYPLTVSSTQAHMKVRITTEHPTDNSVIDDWQFSYRINGDAFSGGEELIVTLGDVYNFVTRAVTNDGTRNSGDVEGSFTIDESGVEGGCVVRQEFILEDTRPDHAGESTSFTVTYEFLRAVQ